jgi:hypothetical protein
MVLVSLQSLLCLSTTLLTRHIPPFLPPGAVGGMIELALVVPWASAAKHALARRNRCICSRPMEMDGSTPQQIARRSVEMDRTGACQPTDKSQSFESTFFIELSPVRPSSRKEYEFSLE